MTQKLDIKRIIVFLILTFGLAWSAALIIYLTGGLTNSPVLIANTPFTLAVVLLSTVYMTAPAVAHVVTRLVTREGWHRLYLRPKIKNGWPFWLVAWVGPAILTVLGGILFWVIFPQYFDPTLSEITEWMAASGVPFANPWLLVIIQTVAAVLLAPVVNGIFTMGEEFGWRAYLQPKLLPLGVKPMFVIMGLIWGVWHWPVVAMGHNYGLEYPGFPLLGLLATVWFTLVVGIFLGWLTLRAGSVWPAVVGHAALNGIANLGILFVVGQPNPLLGPLPVGIVALLPWTAISLWMFFDAGNHPKSATSTETS